MTAKNGPTYSATSDISPAGPAPGALIMCIIQVQWTFGMTRRLDQRGDPALTLQSECAETYWFWQGCWGQGHLLSIRLLLTD